MIASRSAANLLILCAGLVVWSSAFVLLYAVLSIGCAFGWEAVTVAGLSLQRAVLLGVWAVHLFAVALLLVWTARRARRAGAEDSLGTFFARAGFWAAIVSLVIVAVNYAPILGLSTCL